MGKLAVIGIAAFDLVALFVFKLFFQNLIFTWEGKTAADGARIFLVLITVFSFFRANMMLFSRARELNKKSGRD